MKCMKTSEVSRENAERARVRIGDRGPQWSVPARVEPFATILGSRSEPRVVLPFADTFVHRLMLRMESDGVAIRQA
jgi:hypothetical protein